ncbi:MAG: hypothetical protein K1X64_11945 [Myxococcaceae bacterium]|nr:hypothetical protein [Myxococcaceae bacterium]
MPNASRKSSSNVVELAHPDLPNEEVSSRVTASPLYGVAMLKIAMEMKKADAAPLDDLVQGVLKKMNLPEREFYDFLAMNGGLLRTLAFKRGY